MKASNVGYAPRDRSGSQRLPNSVGLGSVTLAMRSVWARRNVSSSAASERRLRRGSTTAMPGGRSTVLSPSSSECHAPHSQASSVTPSKPSTAATSSDWNDSRRSSPSVTTGRPASSWRRMTSRTARSSIALKAGGSSSPAAWARRASSSSGGRRRLPTGSAWAVTMAVTLVIQHGGELPRDRVGVVSQLAPREAHDPPAGDHELAVFGTVVLEGLTRAVRGEAVALDDEAVVRPGGVELAAIGEPVDLRSREFVGVDESEEVAEALDRIRPAASRVAREEAIREVGLVRRRTGGAAAR